jgi:hypothetical protein
MKTITLKTYAKLILLLVIIANCEILSTESAASCNLSKSKGKKYKKINSSVKKLKRRNKSNTTTKRFPYGFGFEGKCLGTMTTIDTTKMKPASAKFFNDFVNPAIYLASDEFQLCLGDFTPAVIAANTAMNDIGCAAFTLDGSDGAQYGIFGLNVNSVPCTLPPTNVGVCFAMNNDSNTYAVNISGSLLQCFIDETGQAETTAVTDFIGSIALGFSYEAKFTNKINIAFMNQPKSLAVAHAGNDKAKRNDIVTGSINVGGQIFLSVDIVFPKFEIGSFDLSDYFQINAVANVYINYGEDAPATKTKFNEHQGILSKNSPLKKTTKAQALANHKKHKADCQNAMSGVGAEVVINFDAQLVLNLQSLTNGFIPNFAANLGELNVLLAIGKNNISKMRRGVYLYVANSMVSGLLSIITTPIINHGGEWGKHMAKEINKIAAGLNTSIGIFITKTGAGFLFTAGEFTFQCIYKNVGGVKKGSCQVGDKYLSGIIKANAWMISRADNLFDEVKKEKHILEHKVETAIASWFMGYI